MGSNLLLLVPTFYICSTHIVFFCSNQINKPELLVSETEKSDYDFNIEERTHTIE